MPRAEDGREGLVRGQWAATRRAAGAERRLPLPGGDSGRGRCGLSPGDPKTFGQPGCSDAGCAGGPLAGTCGRSRGCGGAWWGAELVPRILREGAALQRAGCRACLAFLQLLPASVIAECLLFSFPLFPFDVLGRGGEGAAVSQRLLRSRFARGSTLRHLHL